MSKDEALRAAHEAGDSAALATIYADHGFAEAGHDLDAGCFYLSFAYVFALEAEHPRLDEIYEFLRDNDRER